MKDTYKNGAWVVWVQDKPFFSFATRDEACSFMRKTMGIDLSRDDYAREGYTVKLRRREEKEEKNGQK